MQKTFDKRITNQLKVLAMAMMVMHHLWNQNGLERYEDFGLDTFLGGGC